MKRTFDEHILRHCIDLDGAWTFCTDPENAGEAEGWAQGLPQGETVMVPSVWNTQMGLLEYEGAAWYQKRFHTRGGTLRFVFEGVMTQADVYLDGERLGGSKPAWRRAFTPLWCAPTIASTISPSPWRTRTGGTTAASPAA